MVLYVQKLCGIREKKQSAIPVWRNLEKINYFWITNFKTNNMGVGAIVIASAAVCAAFLILAEIRQRYL